MIGMLTPQDQLNIRQELSDSRMVYQTREVLVVIPLITSGSNFESFTDSPYDITGGDQVTVTYSSYRLYARTKIVKDTTLLGMTQTVTGLEVGDYLMYFRDSDKPVLDKLISPVNKDAYLVIDGLTMRPYNDTLNGVGGNFDVFVHGKKFSPRYRMLGT